MADSVAHTHSSKARPEGRALLAFSLVEVVMVLVIMVVIAAIAVPRYAEADARYRLDGAARRIQSDIEFARAACRSDGQTRTFQFDASADTYQVTAKTGGSLAGKTQYVVAMADSPYRAGMAVGGGSSSFSVDIDGRGEIQGRGALTLTIGNEAITLTFNSNVTSSGICIVPVAVSGDVGSAQVTGVSAGP